MQKLIYSQPLKYFCPKVTSQFINILYPSLSLFFFFFPVHLTQAWHSSYLEICFLNMVPGLSRTTTHLTSEGSYTALITPIFLTHVFIEQLLLSDIDQALMRKVEIALMQSSQKDRPCTKYYTLDT